MERSIIQMLSKMILDFGTIAIACRSVEGFAIGNELLKMGLKLTKQLHYFFKLVLD
ncbi:hypothetical protein [Microcoleus sp. bin48.metabat.b7b8b9.023]|uniref:hypothetical protein n=1 Tax=Microcoleus sp. bin48.metabat.b7b8b9.023 TaxID=2742710 RepID=UPI0025F72450|nr:hypothetical protein [Microcoleus sp. bin48.metabat.b7b8b9.023]